MANYLVTGGAGFIGSNIVEHLLDAGERVRVIDNFCTGKRENIAPFADRIELIEGDIRDLDDCRRAVADMDYVLHQAAVASVPRSVADPLTSHEANAGGTLNLLIAGRDARIRRFVYAGSSSAYGDQEAPRKSEDMTPRPRSPYAAAKLACEHYLQAFHACYGLETVTLRYFNVFGPRQDPDSQYSAVIPRFIKAVLDNEQPVIYGDGAQSRDFTYVANNVRANILAATSPNKVAGQVFNIACGASYTLLDLLDRIASILEANVEPRFLAPRAGDVRHSLASIDKARRLLGYDVHVDFKEGLRRTVESYLGTGVLRAAGCRSSPDASPSRAQPGGPPHVG